MKKERILQNSLNVIRKYLKEEGAAIAATSGPTNNANSDQISGLTKNPPVDLKNRKKTQPFKDLFRRGSSSVQPTNNR